MTRMIWLGECEVTLQFFYNKRDFVCSFRQSQDQYTLSSREDNCEQAKQTNYTFKAAEEIVVICKLIDGVSCICISTLHF